ncbi:hypothetical protein BC835DRAFT_186158 [Cytidiella melzeri]|nr:hypothetical protein BC835DRAFT_186158 [Cytidiella melzeri]
MCGRLQVTYCSYSHTTWTLHMAGILCETAGRVWPALGNKTRPGLLPCRRRCMIRLQMPKSWQCSCNANSQTPDLNKTHTFVARDATGPLLVVSDHHHGSWACTRGVSGCDSSERPRCWYMKHGRRSRHTDMASTGALQVQGKVISTYYLATPRLPRLYKT